MSPVERLRLEKLIFRVCMWRHLLRSEGGAVGCKHAATITMPMSSEGWHRKPRTTNCHPAKSPTPICGATYRLPAETSHFQMGDSPTRVFFRKFQIRLSLSSCSRSLLLNHWTELSTYESGSAVRRDRAASLLMVQGRLGERKSTW